MIKPIKYDIMEREFKFKTTLKCSGCVAKVTPLLNSLKDVVEWSVDLKDPDRVLTVSLKTGDTHSVKKAIEGAGYKVEEVR